MTASNGVGHEWIVEELHLTLNSDDQIEQCDRVGAVRYQTSEADRAMRPRT